MEIEYCSFIYKMHIPTWLRYMLLVAAAAITYGIQLSMKLEKVRKKVVEQGRGELLFVKWVIALYWWSSYETLFRAICHRQSGHSTLSRDKSSCLSKVNPDKYIYSYKKTTTGLETWASYLQQGMAPDQFGDIAVSLTQVRFKKEELMYITAAFSQEVCLGCDLHALLISWLNCHRCFIVPVCLLLL